MKSSPATTVGKARKSDRKLAAAQVRKGWRGMWWAGKGKVLVTCTGLFLILQGWKESFISVLWTDTGLGIGRRQMNVRLSSTTRPHRELIVCRPIIEECLDTSSQIQCPELAVLAVLDCCFFWIHVHLMDLIFYLFCCRYYLTSH